MHVGCALCICQVPLSALCCIVLMLLLLLFVVLMLLPLLLLLFVCLFVVVVVVVVVGYLRIRICHKKQNRQVREKKNQQCTHNEDGKEQKRYGERKAGFDVGHARTAR